jgi:NAD(P)H-flavin reductase
MPTKWLSATITSIIDETPFVKRFFLMIHDEAVFSFIAGQFITLDLPISDKRQKRWRSYSIASAPIDDNVIELCIVRKYDGEGTAYLFEKVSVGDTLTFKGPDGAFTLHEHALDKHVVMVCTGTGIAPFRSMILNLINKKLNFKSIHLILGARYEQDILYRNEFEQLAENDSRFSFDIALSRQENWKGHRGYVHDIYKHHYKEVNDETLFYLCGWTNMVDDAVANIIVDLGYDKKQVVYELYG